MRIVKLKFVNRDFGIAYLLNKGLFTLVENEMVYHYSVKAIVEVGQILNEPGETDEFGNMLSEPIYADGYHFDILLDESEITFDNYEIFPTHPRHVFAGFNN